MQQDGDQENLSLREHTEHKKIVPLRMDNCTKMVKSETYLENENKNL